MKKRNKQKKRFIITISFIAFLFVIAIYLSSIHHKISQTAQIEPPNNADYLIVLGARLHGERLSLSLAYRVKTALKYLENNPTTKVIVSGGMGPGEDITEAKAMAHFFLLEGVEENRIILEDQSTSTQENLLFSKKFVGEADSVVIVSNDFHLFRAKMIAKRVGYGNVHTLAAKTPKIVEAKLWMREYAAILKTWLFDH